MHIGGSTPSTWPEDQPVIDLHRDGQSDPHPAFAAHAVTEVGQGAGMKMVKAHSRGGHQVPAYFRNKPNRASMKDEGHFAPPTNSEPAELWKGKAGV